MVESTPTHCAVGCPLTTRVISSARVEYGSGWTKNRYQLSICDSMPQPNSPTPETRLTKSPSRVPTAPGVPTVPMGVAGPVGAPFAPSPPAVCGYQYKNPAPASATAPSVRFGGAPVSERLRRCALSSMCALTWSNGAWACWGSLHTPFAPVGSISLRRGPSDELTIPMCMSLTAGNSGLLPGAQPAPCADLPVTAAVAASMQLGLTRLSMRSGIACTRYCCLSPIDAELSMSNRTSTRLVVRLATAIPVEPPEPLGPSTPPEAPPIVP